MAKSSGTRTPCRTISCRTPSASRSLAQIAAVGPAGGRDARGSARRPPGRPRRSATPGRARSAASSEPQASRIAAATPSRRSCTCGSPDEPPTNAMRRWPCSSRCSAASRPPRTSSTATEHWSGPRRGGRAGPPGRRACAARPGAGRSSAVGVMSTPCTRCSASRSRCAASLSGRSSELQRITARPAALATSSTPRATSVKNGFAMSRTTSPMRAAAPGPQLAGRLVAHEAERRRSRRAPGRGSPG